MITHQEFDEILSGLEKGPSPASYNDYILLLNCLEALQTWPASEENDKLQDRWQKACERLGFHPEVFFRLFPRKG